MRALLSLNFINLLAPSSHSPKSEAPRLPAPWRCSVLSPTRRPTPASGHRVLFSSGFRRSGLPPDVVPARTFARHGNTRRHNAPLAIKTSLGQSAKSARAGVRRCLGPLVGPHFPRDSSSCARPLFRSLVPRPPRRSVSPGKIVRDAVAPAATHARGPHLALARPAHPPRSSAVHRQRGPVKIGPKNGPSRRSRTEACSAVPLPISAGAFS
ncbi:hypothetical protein THAOC_35343, partial [Thalassiosira oceanica]